VILKKLYCLQGILILISALLALVPLAGLFASRGSLR
jgi:hypothetical protein